VESRLRSTDPNSKNLSNLGDWKIENEVEMQQQPIAVRQPIHRLLEIEAGG
jgi:hypothetical protein